MSLKEIQTEILENKNGTVLTQQILRKNFVISMEK